LYCGRFNVESIKTEFEMILDVDENIKQEIERLTNEAFGVFNLENPQPGIDLLIEAYHKIPSPRTKYSESFNLLKYIAIGYFRAGRIDESEKWLSEFLESDFNVRRFGESEYLAAKIALKRNNEALAIQHFIVANQKSEGRVFGSDPEDQEYLKFFKKHAKEHVRPTEFEEMLQVALKEIENNNYPYALSLLYDCLNIQLDNVTVHFNKGLCHFELEELDHATDSFTRAYMLEGEEAFEAADSKFFDFLKTRIEIK
jgi:tetratricopeptide (TPR) repeat protein